jgi:anti-sigma regulatory factor (Ser/Thr protein kinase)
LDEGLRRLAEVAANAHALGPERFVDHVIDELAANTQDDVVVLCLRLEPVETELLQKRIPSGASELAPLREQIRTWLGQRGAPHEAVEDVLLACSEACANSIEHGYRDATGEVMVELRLRQKELDLCVRDHGRWRDSRSDEHRGLGLRLMHGVMNDVYLHADPSGTAVIMRKSLAQPVPAVGA